jgi:2-polyprenyl-6-methoxyphenol hydroxylase-like FAD-dependent oxidoreductase
MITITPNRTFDVAIVGGGVAGSTLGATLAGAGLGVVVVEREPVFRDKVRGEGIHPWGYREAKRLGLDEPLKVAGAAELPLWQTYTDRQPNEPLDWTDDEENPLPEVTVFHPALQQSLIDHAAARGATIIRPGRVTRFTRASRPEITVETGGGTETIAARLVVGADGRTSPARRWLGGRTEQDPAHHRFGGALLGGTALPEGMTHAGTFEGGRTFIFPQGEGRARAYLVATADRIETLQRERGPSGFIGLCASVLAEGLLADATPVGPLAYFPNNDIWASRIAADGLVLMGDAAGANDPSLGQGLSLVFRDARELRDLLLDGADWHQATREFERRRRAYFAVVREHARWTGILTNETGPEADARQERVQRARELDPTAGGFAQIFSRGPDGLVADETARRQFFGEALGVRG